MARKIGVYRWQLLLKWFLIFGLFIALVWQWTRPVATRLQQVPSTSRQGVHDENLDLYPLGWESPYALMPGSPAHWQTGDT